MERKRALRLKRWAFYLLLGMLPVLGGCGREQVADNMILTHKTVQAAQGKAPQEVQPVPVEPSVLSKGMERDSHGNIIYPYFEMKYDIATAPFYHLEAVKVEKIPYNGKGTIAD